MGSAPIEVPMYICVAIRQNKLVRIFYQKFIVIVSVTFDGYGSFALKL